MEKKPSLAEQQKTVEKKALKKSEYMYRGKVINLRKETFFFKNTTPTFREYVEHQGSVGIIALRNDGKFLFIKQYRKAPDEILLEIPAGILEKGENPKDCAIRELQEETGFKPATLISLGSFYPSPGFCTEHLHIFLALDLETSPLPCDLDEAIDLSPLSLQEFYDHLEKNQIRDLKTVAAVFLYMQWKSSHSPQQSCL